MKAKVVIALLATILLVVALAPVASANTIYGKSSEALWTQIIADVPAFNTEAGKSAFAETITNGSPAYSNLGLLVETNRDTKRRASDNNYMLAYCKDPVEDAAIQTLISFYSGLGVFPATR